MRVIIGADHGGYEKKEKIKVWLTEKGYEFEDVGASQLELEDDFVDYGTKVAQELTSDPNSRGILFCRNGVGMNIVANRFPSVRCVLGFDEGQVMKSRNDDDTNCLAIPADYLDENQISELVKVFLETSFSNQERFQRRLKKLAEISIS